MASTTTQIVWLRWLLEDMGISLSASIPMYCDNRSAIQIAHNSVFHERTKHIEIDCHITRHHFQLGTIALPFITSSLQLADFFTKSHTIQRFRFLLDKLSMPTAAS
ncbi:Beta-galactosidase 8 [Ranunculus cassubicifolius]